MAGGPITWALLCCLFMAGGLKHLCSAMLPVHGGPRGTLTWYGMMHHTACAAGCNVICRHRIDLWSESLVPPCSAFPESNSACCGLCPALCSWKLAPLLQLTLIAPAAAPAAAATPAGAATAAVAAAFQIPRASTASEGPSLPCWRRYAALLAIWGA